MLLLLTFAFLSNQMTNLNKRQYCWKNELENELLLRNIPYIFFLLAQLYPKNLFSQLYIFYSLLLFAPEPIVCSKQWDLLYTVHLVVKSVHNKIQLADFFFIIIMILAYPSNSFVKFPETIFFKVRIGKYVTAWTWYILHTYFVF